MSIAIRFEITGDLGLGLVIGEKFEIEGSKEIFAVHASTARELTEEGFQWSATHVETGLRFARGNDIEEVIAEARATWLSKTPAEIEQALTRGRNRKAHSFFASIDAEGLYED